MDKIGYMFIVGVYNSIDQIFILVKQNELYFVVYDRVYVNLDCF